MPRTTPPAGPTLRDLIDWATICEGVPLVVSMMTRAGRMRVEVEDHPALPDLRVLARKQGWELDRQGCFDLRDLLRVARRLSKEQADQFPLEEVVGAIEGTPAVVPPQAGQEDENTGPEPLPAWVGENFSQGMYKLLVALWGRGEVPVGELIRAVYEVRDIGQKNSLEKVKDRINLKLVALYKKIGAFVVQSRRDGEVYILSRPE